MIYAMDCLWLGNTTESIDPEILRNPRWPLDLDLERTIYNSNYMTLYWLDDTKEASPEIPVSQLFRQKKPKRAWNHCWLCLRKSCHIPFLCKWKVDFYYLAYKSQDWFILHRAVSLLQPSLICMTMYADIRCMLSGIVYECSTSCGKGCDDVVTVTCVYVPNCSWGFIA